MLKPITPIDLHLAKRLREIRVLKGMSQEKLGELAGLTFQQIQKYEMAKNRIPSSRLYEFAQILQRPVADFFARIKADRMYYNYDFVPERTLQKTSNKFQQELKQLVSAFNRIDDDMVRRHLILITEDLAKMRDRKIKNSYN